MLDNRKYKVSANKIEVMSVLGSSFFLKKAIPAVTKTTSSAIVLPYLLLIVYITNKNFFFLSLPLPSLSLSLYFLPYFYQRRLRALTTAVRLPTSMHVRRVRWCQSPTTSATCKTQSSVSDTISSAVAPSNQSPCHSW